MTHFVGELIGTALFVMLGNSVNANMLLSRTKGENGSGGGGWMMICTGWAMALFVGAAVAASASGAHLNPAITIGLWHAGEFPLARVPTYLAGQFLGAALGAVLVWLVFLPHWARTDDPARKLACFGTAPAVRAPISNLFSEGIGTFVLVFGVLMFKATTMAPASGAAPSAMQALAAVNVDLGAAGAIPIALLFWSIALSLGGTTGVGFNPARDLAPRLVHALAPIPGKGSSDWSYAWIPVTGPILGGLCAGLVAKAVQL